MEAKIVDGKGRRDEVKQKEKPQTSYFRVTCIIFIIDRVSNKTCNPKFLI